MNMQLVKTLLWCALLSLSLALARPPAAKAAEADRSREDELRRKTEEVERLKQELQRAQEQLKQLKADNERLQKEQARPARPPSPVPTAPAKPIAPIATLPPLQAGQLVDADELVGHFRADPAAAGARYDKKTFRVKGAVARFDPALALRNYDVILASPESLVGVVCNFRYADRLTAVYTRQKGQLLVARAGAKAEHKLLQVGETVIIQGKCRGLKDGQIVLAGCKLVR